MILSHTKLTTILTNPMDYYLNYRLGMTTKEIRPYFLTGSGVHWGLENNTENLDDFFKGENKDEQCLAQAIIHGFYYHKDEIMKQVFDDFDTHEQLELIDGGEYHELEIDADLPSFLHTQEPHKFVGIIDLLYLTQKGFILLDYKTSSTIPNFDKYLDQLYRYIFELNSTFKDVPIYKIGIINFVKSKIRRLRNETDADYALRYNKLYEQNNNLINIHIFDTKMIEQDKMNDYLHNLSISADLAETIDKNELWWLNMQGATTPYPSIYLPIYNQEENAFMQYKIRDKVFNQDTGEIETERDCIPLDMQVIHSKKVMNKYDYFKKEYDLWDILGLEKEDILKTIKEENKFDDNLLNNYLKVMEKEKNNEERK